MPLAEFKKQYPDDFKSGALEEIRQRYAALAAEASQPPATTRATAAKRARAEAPTALRTVRARRAVAPIAPPPKFADNPPAAAAPNEPGLAEAPGATGNQRSTRARTAAPAPAAEAAAGPMRQLVAAAGGSCCRGAAEPGGDCCAGRLLCQLLCWPADRPRRAPRLTIAD